jgi:hypothetical protein
MMKQPSAAAQGQEVLSHGIGAEAGSDGLGSDRFGLADECGLVDAVGLPDGFGLVDAAGLADAVGFAADVGPQA